MGLLYLRWPALVQGNRGLAVLVAPTLVLAEGLGTGCGLVWMGVAALLWPEPVQGLGDGRQRSTTFATGRALIAGRRAAAASCSAGGAAHRCPWVNGCCCNCSPYEPASLESLNPGLDELATDTLLLGVLLMLSLLLIPMRRSFGLLTRARLLELADQERPLLRRLSCEAPGTFEHTLMICGLAEEGASVRMWI